MSAVLEMAPVGELPVLGGLAASTVETSMLPPVRDGGVSAPVPRAFHAPVASVPMAAAGTSSSAMSHAPVRLRTRAERLVVRDSVEAIGYPICPIGDQRIQHNVVDAKGERRIAYPSIGWQIITPTPKPGESLPWSAIMDVYVGLLLLLDLAGYPEDGVVEFSRYEFLQLIGWVSSGKGRSGERTVRPSGRHYEQLKAAAQYLLRTTFENDSPAPQLGLDGKMFRGWQGFTILESARIVRDETGPRPEGRSLSARSRVVFTRSFMQMLGQGERTAPIDLDLFLSLPMGTPRHLCRLFSWMWSQNRTEISVEEIFQRLGSTQHECVPARARQILGKAHAALEERGVLTAPPEYVKRDGTWYIAYAFGDPEAVLSGEELMIRQAAAYGVTAGMARTLTISHRAQFAEVLAATTLGYLRPKKTLAAMVVHFTRHGIPVAPPEEASDQLGLELPTPETQYLQYATDARARRLAHRRDLDLDVIRREVAEWLDRDAARDGVTHESWVLDGVVAMRLNAALGVETFDAYRAAMMAG